LYPVALLNSKPMAPHYSDAIDEKPRQPVLMGFDPGRDKCGLAIMGVDRHLYYHDILTADNTLAEIQRLYQIFPVSHLVMGDQTTSQAWRKKLQALPEVGAIISIDERYTSQAARERYWQMYPPQGFYRLIPKGMRLPPRPIDDIAAILLIERYLGQFTQLE